MILAAKKLAFRFSQYNIPKIDINSYLNGQGNWQQDCKEVAEALRTYGLLVIKDPRVDSDKNNKFLDMNEKYFQKRSQQFHAGIRNIDLSPIPKLPFGLIH